jgi:hypothetical protein
MEGKIETLESERESHRRLDEEPTLPNPKSTEDTPEQPTINAYLEAKKYLANKKNTPSDITQSRELTKLDKEAEDLIERTPSSTPAKAPPVKGKS